MNRVFILGGGVAGLTAAHELAERGFDVTVFEKEVIFGGKARSMPNIGSGTGGRGDLPGEHGFRFFPGFYWHTSDTMKRIKLAGSGSKTVFDNFVAGEKIGLAHPGQRIFRLEANPPTNLIEWAEALMQMFANPSIGVPLDEAKVFVRKLLCFLGSGPTRRAQQLEATSWWNFVEADGKSDAYKNTFAKGLSRSLVAMKPAKASTLTVGTMLVQIVVNILHPVDGSNADRVLNAPTNEAWIDPWVAQLRAAGVTMHTEHRATALNFDGATKKITGVTVTSANGVQQFGDASDFYIAAVPVEIVQFDNALFPPALKDAARLNWVGSTGSAMGVDKLETDWMTGVLFYLNREAAALKGHVIYCDSPWALTSISQAQFWTGYPWANKGNGQVRDILSSIISDWDTVAPRLGTDARNSGRNDIINETWEQLKEHLAAEPLPGRIADADREGTPFLDPAIEFAGGTVTNSAPLLVNVINSRQHRPAATTALTNFFVAADYVKTITDLACMEAANEAARHAVNGLLTATGSTKPKCAITPLKEPAIFKPFQDLDETDYLANPNSEPILCRYFEQLVGGIAAGPPSGIPKWAWALIILGAVNAVMLAILLLRSLGVI